MKPGTFKLVEPAGKVVRTKSFQRAARRAIAIAAQMVHEPGKKPVPTVWIDDGPHRGEYRFDGRKWTKWT